MLLADKDTEQLHLYQHSRGGGFTRVWTQPCPDGVTADDSKQVSGRGDQQRLLCRDYDSDPTRVLTRQLQQQAAYTLGGRWRLRAVLPGGRQVYAEWTGDHARLRVHRGEQQLAELTPPRGWEDNLLSVCADTRTGSTAVTDCMGNRLHIFDGEGEFLLIITLKIM